ncbi:hypothetical protein EV361DRAFT_1029079 [Lentinula raphanica]|nr:hypothetical protein EV361DRAFT_1029079 [Lentinula raphanica]
MSRGIPTVVSSSHPLASTNSAGGFNTINYQLSCPNTGSTLCFQGIARMTECLKIYRCTLSSLHCRLCSLIGVGLMSYLCPLAIVLRIILRNSGSFTMGKSNAIGRVSILHT